ncbi:MAG: UDP-glucose/GDP-mannose dehydrogenase family protein [Burkholderiaceae bacterium]|nr:UDP-glucose/GDP-mannose dehydrogenase family protein [Burkholderiaceae bacterium]
MKICILGLGYVGAVSLACLARDGHEVRGVDIDPQKVDLINAGKTPVVEAGMVELMQRVVASGRACASTEVEAALQVSEVAFVCVGTPSADNGSQDQSAVLAIARQIGYAIRDKIEHTVVVFRSTLTPGTVEDVLIPLLEDTSGKQEGEGFSVAFQPEFLREGSSIKDYDNPPFTIIGCRGDRPEAAIRSLFDHLPGDINRTTIRTAEMVKYCCNNFHALKITFANETARLCDALGINSLEVMDLVCRDTQLNISKAYLKPGFAFGGSCLPKDLRATAYLANQSSVELPMLAGILRSNQVHLDMAVKRILARGVRKVGLIGLSFKAGTDDLRESPMVALAEQLIGKGVAVEIYDPEVYLSRILGANKKFLDSHLPHIGPLLHDRIDDLIDHCAAIVVAIKDPRAMTALAARARPEQWIFDLVGMTNAAALPCEYEGLCW